MLGIQGVNEDNGMTSTHSSDLLHPLLGEDWGEVKLLEYCFRARD